MNTLEQKNRTTLIKLIGGSVLMFGFGFALVPLYDVFCEVTGLNGKVTNTGPYQGKATTNERTISVQLLATNNASMPWAFQPEQPMIKVALGESRHTAYVAFNPTQEHMIGQAVPSVSPSEAAQYLHKVNCFCFERQPLDSLESRKMPLLFVVDPELPDHIRTITLSYTLFDITPRATNASHRYITDTIGRNTL